MRTPLLVYAYTAFGVCVHRFWCMVFVPFLDSPKCKVCALSGRQSADVDYIFEDLLPDNYCNP